MTTSAVTASVLSPVAGAVPTYNATTGQFESKYPGSVHVATLAALTALPTANLAEGALAYVLTLKDLFLLVSSTGLTPDGISIVASASGSFYWLRQNIGHAFWRNQATWYIGGSTGVSDENDGSTSVTPIGSFAELNRRLAGEYYVAMTVQLQEGSTPGVLGITGGTVLEFTASPRVLAGSAVPTISFVGPAVSNATTSSVTSATNGVNATNTGPTLRDTTVVSWTSSVGKMVRIISGGSSGATAFIAKDVGSNTARVTDWMASSKSLVSAPAGGSLYSLFTPATGITGIAISMTATGYTPFPVVSIKNLSITNGTIRIQATNVEFTNCIFAGAFVLNSASILAACCYFTGSVTIVDTGYIKVAFSAFPGGVELDNSLSHEFSACLFQGAGTGIAVGVTSTAFAHLGGCAFFDCGAAINIGPNSDVQQTISIYGHTYGSGNTTAVLMNRGSTFAANANGVKPFITGSTELSIEGATTFIPQLVASSAVPAAATLTTWAQLNASPFNGQWMNPNSGTKILK